jgi:hypothetical protein
MAAGRYTSRVFVAGEALHTALEALTIPAFQGRTPEVRFGDVDPDYGAEAIVISVNLDRQQIEWARLAPAGRDEVLAFDVVHRIMNPNVKTPDAVWQRLEEVAELVQSVLYDTATETTQLLDFTGEVNMHRIDGVVPEIGPGPQGWIGACTTSMLLRARI